jgi:mannose-6-phosphate isomerase-like protein (cupin superfamily)
LTEAKVFELSELVARLKKEGGYFLDFLKIRDLEAGIIVLRPGEKDTQDPHSADELYYVIQGSAMMELDKTSRSVGAGSIVFVPAGIRHRFYGNREDLVVLYMFAG